MENTSKQLSRIYINNILGIEEISIEPGAVTLIKGQNGVGKSSIIEAIKTALQTGKDATLIHSNKPKGEIVLQFNDGLEVQRTITEKGAYLKIYENSQEVTKQRQTYLDALYDIISINPISFITSKPEDRLKYLLEVLPIAIDKEKIEEILGDEYYEYPGQAIDVLDAYIKNVVSKRLNVNKDIDSKEGAIKQLKETLVEADFNPDEIKSHLEDIKAKIEAANSKNIEFVTKFKDTYDKEVLNAQLNYNDIVQKALENKELAIAKANEAYALERGIVNSQFTDYVDTLKNAQSKAEQKLEMIGALNKTKELIVQYNDEVKTLNTITNSYTEQISKLREYKANILDNLPIKDLIVKDGKIFYKDLPFDRINTAEQIKIAFQIAKLRLGDIKVMVCDGIEKLDYSNIDIIINYAKADGIQLILTEVNRERDNKELQVINNPMFD